MTNCPKMLIGVQLSGCETQQGLTPGVVFAEAAFMSTADGTLGTGGGPGLVGGSFGASMAPPGGNVALYTIFKTATSTNACLCKSQDASHCIVAMRFPCIHPCLM